MLVFFLFSVKTVFWDQVTTQIWGVQARGAFILAATGKIINGSKYRLLGASGHQDDNRRAVWMFLLSSPASSDV